MNNEMTQHAYERKTRNEFRLDDPVHYIFSSLMSPHLWPLGFFLSKQRLDYCCVTDVCTCSNSCHLLHVLTNLLPCQLKSQFHVYSLVGCLEDRLAFLGIVNELRAFIVAWLVASMTHAMNMRYVFGNKAGVMPSLDIGSEIHA